LAVGPAGILPAEKLVNLTTLDARLFHDEMDSPSAGESVNSNAGRTLVAIPKSSSQISPLLGTGIFFFHRVEQTRTLRCRLIAGAHILIFGRQLEEFLSHRPSLCFAQLWQFFENFRRAHRNSLTKWLTFCYLQKMDYKNVHSMACGLKAWKAAGLPTTQ
jgi:hypothetical protein